MKRFGRACGDLSNRRLEYRSIMASIAKAILVAIIAAVVLILMTQAAFFFPFYMTVVGETFSLSNVAANDNYVSDDYYSDAFEELKERPLFKRAYERNHDNLKIEIVNSAGRKAVGNGDVFYWSDHDGPVLPTGEYKPYCQRGEPITITVRAVYPIEMQVWGRTLKYDVPVSYKMVTVGLKYYKDLDYEYLYW